LAAGVGFGSEDIGNALMVAIGIALQNIPEGMVIISPMILVGISKRRALLIGSATGLVEVIGTFIGYLVLQFQRNTAFCSGFCRRYDALRHQ